jgi:hypothetical protein
MIAVICCECAEELSAKGAILFGPPDDDDFTKKDHLCVACYQKVGPRRFLEKAMLPAVRDVINNRPGSLQTLAQALTAYDRLR